MTRTLVLLGLLLAACGGGRRPSDGVVPDLGSPAIDLGPFHDSGPPIDLGPRPDLGPLFDAGPGVDGGGPTVDGGGGGSDAGPPIAICQHGCDGTAASCATGSAAFDEDNYACVGSVCHYLGCNDDAECQSSFSDDRYVCNALGTPRACALGCTVGADCATASAAFDADNYTCSGGICHYVGCNDDAECQSSFADARYVCRMVMGAPGLPLPMGARNCVLGCSVASDCATASAAFDGDNYACTGGSCVYRGCNTDAECMSSFASTAYVCR